MSLSLDLKYLVGLTGKGDRKIKATFREAKHTSRIATGHDSVYFGHILTWPVSRPLDDRDILSLEAYQVRKSLPDSLIGTVIVNLYPLIRDSVASLRENLVDSSNHATGKILIFDLRYQSPDSTQGGIDDNLLQYPSGGIEYGLDDAHNQISLEQPTSYSQTGGEGDLNQLIDQELANQEDWDIASNLSAPEQRDPRIEALLGPTIFKSKSFQFGITVVEARKLLGSNINPMVTVTVGKVTQKTIIRFSTNRPFYDHYFSFDFTKPKISVLTETIRVRVFNMSAHPLLRYLPGKLLGEFVTDVQTVYNQKGHMILNKWAVLIDPKDPWCGPKGYLKLDMTVIEEGQQIKRIRRERPDEDENIEANLILPRHVDLQQKRIMLSLKVNVYQAEDLPPMNTEISDKIRKAFMGESTPNLDSLVEVSYAGQTVRTKIERYTYNPIWNQTLEFVDYFPSFTQTIRITVRNGGVKKELISTHLIDIREIMCRTADGFLPHFGPAWINLYGTPRIYTYAQMLRPEQELNQGLGEGVAYRGRLLVSIQSREDEDAPRIGTNKYVASPVSETVAGKKSLYFMFASIMEVSVIDRKLGGKNKPISFEMSLGLYGDELDGKRGGVEPQPTEIVQPVSDRQRVDWCHTTTDPMLPTSEDKEYYFLEIGRRKPCLYLTGFFEDHRSRMCIPNILEKLAEEYHYQTQRVKHLIIRRQNVEARRYLRLCLLKMAKAINSSQETVKACRDTASSTLLDRDYSRRIRRDLRRMATLMVNIAKSVKKNNVGEKMKEANGVLRHLRTLIHSPQDGLPDVFISMIIEGQRVGFVRIPARDIYYSAVDQERGKWSGQVATLYVRKQGREGEGPKGWSIQSQLRVYLWLGLIKDFTAYTLGVPKGYEPDSFIQAKPPEKLVYRETSRFELRCYIFIARDLLASDSSGLSDPFARVIIGPHVLQTQVLYQTGSPMWDVLLHRHIIFYQEYQSIKNNLQEIIVEVFDSDPGNEIEFLGRCFAQINVTLDGENYIPPRLQWWPIFRGQTPAGELLAAFDLIQLDPRVPFTNLPTFEELARYTHEFDDRVILKSIPGMVLDDDDDLNRDSTDEDETEFDFMDENDSEYYFDVDSLLRDNESTKSKSTQRKQIKIGMAPPQLVLVRREGDYRIPDNVRPPLQRFRVEVLFWSVWGMIKQNLLPVKRPRVVVEIGGYKLESEVIRNLSKRRLFDTQLKVMDVYLPVDERYWPPLILTCFDNRMFGTKTTVGSHTISNVRDYLVFDKEDGGSDSASTVFIDSESEWGGRMNFGFDFGVDETNIDSESTLRKPYESDGDKYDEYGQLKKIKFDEHSSSDQELLADINPNFQLDDKIKLPEKAEDLDQLVHQYDSGEKTDQIISGTTGPGQALPVSTRAVPTEQQLASADWWTRFYVTLRSGEVNYSEGRYKNKVDPLTESEDSDIDEKLNKVVVKDDQESEEEKIEQPAQYLDYKQKRKLWKKTNKGKKKKLTAYQKRQLEVEKRRAKAQKKKNKKSLRKKIKEKFINSKGLFKKEFLDLNYEMEQPEDQSWVEQLTIFPVSLEDLPEFKGFEEPFKNLPFYKGKQKDDSAGSNRITGYFKGNLIIYPVNDDQPIPNEMNELRLFKTLPLKAKVKLTVRVYIVRAIELHPTDPNGKSDPYLVITLGKTVINDRDDYKPKNLNPLFGKCFEFVACLPMDSLLSIQLMDYDRIGSDDLIGETHIDIENRYHSLHRATCGLMPKYYAHGYCQWKDSQQPTEILEKLCNRYNIEQPVYNILENRVTIGGQDYYADTEIHNETGATVKSVEPLALQALQNWASITKSNIRLVEEHVETRSLVHPEKPGLTQGRLQLWIDMFEREVAVPPPAIDISPRVPVGYELRVIIWNTAEVKLADTSLFSSEMSSDIYVKGWIKGVGIDDQKTDVHYRSLSGEGNFNWRFIFPFDYIKAEDRVVYPIKETFDLEPQTFKSNCELSLQVWDADLITSDKFLGAISLRLTSIPRYAKTSKSCGLHQLDPECPKFSIFKNKNVRGWWPVTDEEDEQIVLQGKVECELQLLTASEAENNPAGPAREEPNGLPKPNRPDSSFMAFLGPLNTLRYLIKYRLKWILIKIFIIFLICLIVFLFLYSFPGAVVSKIVNPNSG